MKRYLAVLVGCSLLGACVYHETDMQLAQERRDAALAQKRAQIGCSFIRDHDAYRQCLMNTYEMQHQKGYETRDMTNGQSVAIIGGVNAQPTSSCGCAAKCNNSCGGGCAGSNPNYYQMQAQIAPLPVSGPQIVPYTTSESTTVETTCTKNYAAQEASFMTTEVIPTPAPRPVQVVRPIPVAPAPVPPPVVEPLPQPEWWQNYQENRQPQVVQKPVCPCPDPNDPCPQCFDK